MLWLTLACKGPTTDTSPPDEAGLPERVVILVLDGVGYDQSFSNEAWQDDYVGLGGFEQVARRLMPYGATGPLYNTGVTVTAPAHCELTTGRPLHLGNFGTKQGSAAYVPEWPGLFHALQDAGEQDLLAIGNTINLELLTRSLYVGASEAGTWRFVSEDALNPITDDGVVADELLEHLLGDAPPTLTVVNFHEVDRDGHAGLEEAYRADLSLLDDIVIDVWTALQGDERHAGKTVLLVTADHGRHDHDGNKGWLNHGDNCAGCRHVPFLMVGPGVKDGVSLSEPASLHDLAPTLAHLLGVELPFAQGRILTELLDDPGAAVSTSGAVDLTGAGEMSRTLRGGVSVGGVQLSTESAYATAAPSFAAGGQGELACWRELALTGDDMPWTPHCRWRDGSDWQDVGFVVEAVGPDFELGLLGDDEGFWAVFVDNVVGSTVEVVDPVTVRLLRFEDGDWVGAEGEPLDAIFPLFPVVTADAEGPVVAFAASASENQARYERRLQIYRPGWSDGVTAWGDDLGHLTTRDWTDDVQADRQERPALHSDDRGVQLAFLHSGSAGTVVGRAQVGPVGTSSLRQVGDAATTLATVPPRFGPDGTLWFGAMGAEGAEVCQERDDAVTCTVVGARLDGVSPGTSTLASVDAGDGVWAAIDVGG